MNFLDKDKKKSEVFIAIGGLVIGLLAALPSMVLVYDRLFKEIPNIEFSAVDYIDGLHNNVGASPFPKQIGMLHNRIVRIDGATFQKENVERPNSVRYKFLSQISGKYNLSVFYASELSRPIKVYINGKFVSEGLYQTTSCWDNDCRTWSMPICVKLNEGENILEFDRASSFPHLSRIKFVYTKKC